MRFVISTNTDRLIHLFTNVNPQILAYFITRRIPVFERVPGNGGRKKASAVAGEVVADKELRSPISGAFHIFILNSLSSQSPATADLRA
jgi:hypothetical protein